MSLRQVLVKCYAWHQIAVRSVFGQGDHGYKLHCIAFAICLLIGSFLFPPPDGARAQNLKIIEFGTDGPSIGDVFIYQSNEGTTTAYEVQSPGVYERAAGEIVRKNSDGNTIQSGDRIFDPHNGYRPPGAIGNLKIGQAWTHRYSIGKVVRVRKCEVTGQEDISTKAGRFENTFKVSCENKRTDRKRPRHEEIWFLPNLELEIKYSAKWYGSSPGSFSHEIVSVKRANQNLAKGAAVRYFVNTKASTPVVTIGPAQIKRHLAIFISPSCNFCNKLYLDIVESMKAGDTHFHDIEVTFALMPRSDSDYRAIKGLMCVGTERFADAVHLYSEEIFKRMKGRAIPDDEAIVVSKLITKRFGVVALDYERCVESEEYERVISQVFLIGDSLRTRDGVPIVMYQNEHHLVDEFHEVVAILEGTE